MIPSTQNSKTGETNHNWLGVCGRQTISSSPPEGHAPVRFPSSGIWVGLATLLTNRIQQKWRDVHDYVYAWLCYITQWLSLSCWFWWCRWLWWGTHKTGISSLVPTSILARKRSPHSYRKKMNSAHNLRELGSSNIQIRPPPQLTSWLQPFRGLSRPTEMWDNKCVLF